MEMITLDKHKFKICSVYTNHYYVRLEGIPTNCVCNWNFEKNCIELEQQQPTETKNLKKLYQFNAGSVNNILITLI